MAGSDGGGGRDERRADDGGAEARGLLGAGLTGRGLASVVASRKSLAPGMKAKLWTWLCSGLSDRRRSTTRVTVAVPEASRASGCWSE